jgi:hypothetical protein
MPDNVSLIFTPEIKSENIEEVSIFIYNINEIIAII